MVDIYVLDGVLYKVKKIVNAETIEDPIILIWTDDKSTDEVTLKHFVFLLSTVLKNWDQF